MHVELVILGFTVFSLTIGRESPTQGSHEALEAVPFGFVPPEWVEDEFDG